MRAEWNSQQGEGRFAIQFETDDRTLYKMVEKACQNAVDKANRCRVPTCETCKHNELDWIANACFDCVDGSEWEMTEHG